MLQTERLRGELVRVGGKGRTNKIVKWCSGHCRWGEKARIGEIVVVGATRLEEIGVQAALCQGGGKLAV